MTISHTTSNEKAYFVEVRSGTKTPVAFDGNLYGSEWTPYTPSNSCLPPSGLHSEAAHHGYLTWEAANAIVWMVAHLAHAFVPGQNLIGLQARVVEVNINWSFKADRVREFEPPKYGAPPVASRSEGEP